MSAAYGAAGASGAGAAAVQAAINALTACGPIVTVDEQTFLHLIEGQEQPVVVRGMRGFWKKTKPTYLTPLAGLFFVCKAQTELPLPAGAWVVQAKKISIPAI